MDFEFAKYTLDFKFKAGTSRGVMNQKDTWFIKLKNGGKNGVGECGILRGLSIEKL